jgi:hypothetical protein
MVTTPEMILGCKGWIHSSTIKTSTSYANSYRKPKLLWQKHDIKEHRYMSEEEKDTCTVKI